jgi:GNAT superfamily N-acetyltransferase
LKTAGLKTGKGFSECRIDFTSELLDRYREILAKAEQDGFFFRTLDMNRCKADTEVFRVLHNETFANHWGATRMESIEEALELTEGMQGLMVPDFVIFAECKGESAGYYYGFPDLNQAFKAVQDSKDSFPLDQALSKINRGLLLSVGVMPAFRGRGLARALGAKVLLAMANKGYAGANPTLILDENHASLAFHARLGAKPWRNYICYEAPIG